MEKCNVIPVILAFSRKKAFNYERAKKVRGGRRMENCFFLHFLLQMNSFLNLIFFDLHMPYFI
jgi:hypothetical protein